MKKVITVTLFLLLASVAFAETTTTGDTTGTSTGTMTAILGALFAVSECLALISSVKALRR